MNSKICCIVDCGRPVLARGMCNKHYVRNRKFGSPVAQMPRSAAMQGLSAPDRFAMQMKAGDADECWPWIAGKDRDGYGVFRGVYDGVMYGRATRYSWALHNRKQVPANMLVCHSCDNPSCVNPNHLFLGTDLDNMLDKIAKDRHNIPKGELNVRAVLTEKQAIAILADPRPYLQIAADYGVSDGTINDIKNKYSWKHLDAPAVKNPNARLLNRRGKGTKLTAEKVSEIRASTESGVVLAAKYGVSKGMISAIKARLRWAHV